MSSALSGYVERGAAAARAGSPELFRVSVSNSLPLIAGGPDGNTTFVEGGKRQWWGLRATAVRGVWRWWVRALLAGLLWGEGYACDYEGLARIEKALGLGDTGEASSVYLNVEYEVKGEPRNQLNEGLLRGKPHEIIRKLENACRGRKWDDLDLSCLYLVPRYRLLVTGKKPWERKEILLSRQPIPPGSADVRVSLRLRQGCERYRRYEAIYRYALLLALGLGGVGQVTSRGFGKFSLEEGLEVWDRNLVKNVYEDLSSELGSSLDTILRVASSSCKKRGRLPFVPTFHPDTALYGVVDAAKYIGAPHPSLSEPRYYGSCRSELDVLVSVGRAALKAEWKLFHGKRLFVRGRSFHTWLMGLPKAIVRQGTPESGYFFDVNGGLELGRWQSSVRMTPFSRNGGWGVAVYGFLTEDFYEALRRGLCHKPKGRRCEKLERYLRGRDLEDVFRESFDTVVGLLSGRRRGVRAW